MCQAMVAALEHGHPPAVLSGMGGCEQIREIVICDSELANLTDGCCLLPCYAGGWGDRLF